MSACSKNTGTQAQTPSGSNSSETGKNYGNNQENDSGAKTNNGTPVVEEYVPTKDMQISQMFFGYYDLCPYDKSGKHHLAHKTAFADRLRTIGDQAEVGYIDLSNGKFISVAVE